MPSDLTPANIRSMLPGDVLNDDTVRGLRCRARQTARVFEVYYRAKDTGQQRRVRLGTWPTMQVDSARKAARQILDHVAVGRDPAAEWRAGREAPTVADLWQHYLAWLKRNREPSTVAEYERQVKSVLEPAPLAAMRVADVQLQHVETWLEAVRRREFTRGKAFLKNGKHTPNKASAPKAANRALAILSGMFRHAELRTGNPAAGAPPWRPRGSNPCAGAEQAPPGRRDRYATPEELERLGEELRRLEDSHLREVALLRVHLYTGARTGELVKAQVYDVAGDWLRLGAHKTARRTGEKKVYLPDAAREELERVSRVRGASQKLFGPMPDKNPVRAVWERVREAAGCPDLQIKDLRRTFASLAYDPESNSDANLKIIGGLLGHTQEKTTKIYTVLFAEAKKRVAEATAGRAAGMLSGRRNQQHKSTEAD